MSVWDDPELASTEGDYVMFNKAGDSVDGIVKSLGKKTWDDGKISAEVVFTLDSGDEITGTFGQYKLKALLIEERPEVGDRLKIVCTGIEKRSGKTHKDFSVTVTRAGQAPAPTVNDDAPPF